MRTGAYALSLLATPINVQVLAALKEGPRSLVELRRAAGSPPPTTFRGRLRKLNEIGAVARRQRGSDGIEYALLESGQELLAVAETLRTWLAGAPDGPIEPGSTASKSAVKAMAAGWSTGIVRALAAKPLTLTELDRLIVDITYPSLERRLEAMRLAGQIEPAPSKGRGTPYTVTEWLRQAIAPIIAGVHWERMRMPDATAEVTRVDVEAAFMMAIPMLSLPSGLSGSSRLAVRLNGKAQRLAGVMVEVEEGQIGNCTSRLSDDARASGIGEATAWIQAVTEPDPERLSIEGDRRLTSALVEGLHDVLFGSVRQG